MEKIKTPLGQLLESLNKRRSIITERMDHPKCSKSSVRRYKHELYFIDKELKIVKSLLPSERDMIEKAYNSVATASNLLTRGSDYFTQTFESYE